MAAAYDAIARDYQRSKASPLRAAIESWTIDRLLGDIHGAAIFDAGCGDGFHARRLKAAGASRIAGVDVSAAMIELAREAERRTPQGIQYQCCAVEDLPEDDDGENDQATDPALLARPARLPTAPPQASAARAEPAGEHGDVDGVATGKLQAAIDIGVDRVVAEAEQFVDHRRAPANPAQYGTFHM